MPNEVVLVAADERVKERRRVGLHFNAIFGRCLRGPIAQVRFREPIDGKNFERNKRQEHVFIQIRDYRFRWDGRMRRKILGSKQSFFFAGYQHEKDRPSQLLRRFLERVGDIEQQGRS